MEERLNEIEKFGAAFFTPDEVEEVMQEAGLSQKIRDNGTPEYCAYRKGYLLTKYEIRLNEIAMAKNGSSPAQNSLEKLIKSHEFEEISKR